MPPEALSVMKTAFKKRNYLKAYMRKCPKRKLRKLRKQNELEVEKMFTHAGRQTIETEHLIRRQTWKTK